MTAEQLDPNKFHVLTPEQRRNFILCGVLVVLLVLPALGALYYKFAINRPAQDSQEMIFEISRGASISEIATDLYQNDLVNSEFLFKLFVFLNGLDQNIQAGVYRIPQGVSVVELTKILQTGRNDLAITFLEGWRVEEFAAEATKNLENVDYNEFIRLAKGSEGYLFPDTYFFNNETSEVEIVEKLRNTFNDKTKNILIDENLDKLGLSAHEVMVFASIVEREVKTEEDRRIVAGILIKRWQNDELIGADATTQYAVGTEQDWWPQRLTQEDLDLNSPYNTREVVGLPPTPICNPGLDAINSIFEYTKTDYNYYLTDSEGVTHYARTLDEHNTNAAKYL